MKKRRKGGNGGREPEHKGENQNQNQNFISIVTMVIFLRSTILSL